METKQDNELLVSDNQQMQAEINKLMLENEILKNQLNMGDLSMNYERINFIINESQKEIDSSIEHALMQEELQKLVSGPSVKENIVQFEKKIA